MTPEQIAWLECQEPACQTGMAVDVRHVPNLTARGGWLCDEHESQEAPC